MESFIIYIAKSGIWTGIFLVIYVLFLRKTTFFRFNRFFLIAGFIASLILSAINYTYDVVISIPLLPIEDRIPAMAQSVASSPAIDTWSVLFVLYVLGMLVLLIRNVCSYHRLKQYITNGERLDAKEYKLIESDIVKFPFTVLNFILINTNRLSSAEKELILKHEITHIRQKHWIDLIAGECMLLLQWFNPLIWIYVYLLKENHEYLADKAVLDSGVSPALYQAVLINQEFQGPVFSFSNSFNYSKPLNRLSMMKKAKSASWKRLAALMIIPVSGLFLWASAEPRYIIEQTSFDFGEYLTGKDTVDLHMNIESSDSTQKVYYFRIGDTTSIDNSIVRTKVFTVSKDKESKFFVDGVKGDSADIQEFEFKNINYHDSLYEVKAKNGIMVLTTNKLNGKPVRVQTQLIRKSTDSISENEGVGHFLSNVRIIPKGNASGKVSSSTMTLRGDTINIRVKNTSSIPRDKPLVILDGKKISYDKMNEIAPNTIDNISVLKDKSAIDVYGEDGKNGVIIIHTKEYVKENPSSEKVSKVKVIGYGSMSKINKDLQLDKPLLIIDGKEEPDKSIDSLDAKDIKSMHVYKGEEAIKKYGDKGKNGVIVIITE